MLKSSLKNQNWLNIKPFNTLALYDPPLSIIRDTDAHRSNLANSIVVFSFLKVISFVATGKFRKLKYELKFSFNPSFEANLFTKEQTNYEFRYFIAIVIMYALHPHPAMN